MKFSAYSWVRIVLYLDGKKKGKLFFSGICLGFLCELFVCFELFVCHEAEESTHTCRQANFGAINIKTDPVLMKTTLI